MIAVEIVIGVIVERFLGPGYDPLQLEDPDVLFLLEALHRLKFLLLDLHLLLHLLNIHLLEIAPVLLHLGPIRLFLLLLLQGLDDADAPQSTGSIHFVILLTLRG